MVHEEDVEQSSVAQPAPEELVHVFLPNGSIKEMTKAEAAELESDG